MINYILAVLSAYGVLQAGYTTHISLQSQPCAYMCRALSCMKQWLLQTGSLPLEWASPDHFGNTIRRVDLSDNDLTVSSLFEPLQASHTCQVQVQRCTKACQAVLVPSSALLIQK